MLKAAFAASDGYFFKTRSTTKFFMALLNIYISVTRSFFEIGNEFWSMILHRLGLSSETILIYDITKLPTYLYRNYSYLIYICLFIKCACLYTIFTKGNWTEKLCGLRSVGRLFQFSHSECRIPSNHQNDKLIK